MERKFLKLVDYHQNEVTMDKRHMTDRLNAVILRVGIGLGPVMHPESLKKYSLLRRIWVNTHLSALRVRMLSFRG